MAGLPNAGAAIVDRAKLADYVLNPSHRVGGNKARVFRAALGLGPEDAALLEAALLMAAATEDAVLLRTNAFGDHYSVDFVLELERGAPGSVRSGSFERAKTIPASCRRSLSEPPLWLMSRFWMQSPF